ncbi:hypothetical protein RV14_GL000773 [Enterococcus ratti]|uniref:D-Ala-teichoic acid biosynthesis protein n=1 Tax=Enterococcus ratti TaxID=150033 RepID=A0A1L8WFL9_9ENTE|nr:hypothetical protein RV14_GL000773 [Enterococcus ratti]
MGKIILRLGGSIKMKKWWNHPQFKYWAIFVGRTLLYTGILFMLIYLYHYKNVQGGSFIYNEF